MSYNSYINNDDQSHYPHLNQQQQPVNWSSSHTPFSPGATSSATSAQAGQTTPFFSPQPFSPATLSQNVSSPSAEPCFLSDSNSYRTDPNRTCLDNVQSLPLTVPADHPSHMASSSSPPPTEKVAPSTRKSTKTKDGTSITRSALSSGSLWTDPDSLLRIPSKRAVGFLLTIVIEAIAIISIVAVVFGRVTSDIDQRVQNLKTVSVYLAIFVFGAFFQVILAFDAVRLKNTMQLISVCVSNIALTTSSALEINQIRDALVSQDLHIGGIPCRDNPDQLCLASSTLFPSIKTLLITMSIVSGVFEVLLLFWVCKLWTEFGWVVYQKIGADLRIRKMFMWYQLFIVLLKFTFFFGVGFTILYLILVVNTKDWELGVTIAAVPIAIVTLFAAAYAVRREIMLLMALSLLLMTSGMVYFVYKLTQVWLPSTHQQYRYVRLTITFFSSMAILSLALTLSNGIVCLLNFNRGLKQAHDAVGTFGGVHRRRRHGGSNGQVLDLDQAKETEPSHYPENNIPQPVSLSIPTGAAFVYPSYDVETHLFPSASSQPPPPQPSATRISLD